MDWASIYKILLIVSIFAHPYYKVRCLCFWIIFIQWAIGLLNLHVFCSTNYWYLLSALGEVLCLCTYLNYLQGDKQYIEWYWRNIGGVVLFATLIIINLYQYLGWNTGSLFYDYYLSTDIYIRINRLGFEILLALLWAKDNILSSVGSRITLPNLVMFWILLAISYTSGAY